MIPFDRLGLLFRLFSSWIYPRKAIDDLSKLLRGVDAGGIALDIGGGAGVLTRFAHEARHDLSYIVLDPAHGMLRHAPEYAYKIRAKAESVPLRKNLIGLALMGDTIHHIQDPRRAIMEIKECMAPTGRLFIFDFNHHTFIGHMICRMERLLREPANFFSPDALSDLLIEYGFTTRIDRYGWRYWVCAENIHADY